MNEQQLANHFVRIRRAFQELNRVANDKNFLKNKAAYARVIRAEHKARILCHLLGNEATTALYRAADGWRKN